MTTAITASEALDLDKDNTNEIQAVTAADGTIVVSPAGTNDFTVAVGVISGGPSGSIAANSITQGDIDVNAVGPAEIDSDAVSSDEIDDDSIEAIDINTGAVETDEILDGTIMNVDVAAGAAIDGSKITPTFTAQIDATLGMTSGADILMNGFTVVPGIPKILLGNSTLKENYDFISLEEIEAFVKKNHHLPGIKSAYQAQKEGSWNLSDSNLQNLEKIEELFLHTIEQENKIKALQSENGTLKEELESIKKSIEEIKSALETKE
ncbi:hypothetical protein GQR58_027898 [Nymphon striatum]|nr:hypothetical protein GQR58_027898 [Nymphon striatum]